MCLQKVFEALPPKVMKFSVAGGGQGLQRVGKGMKIINPCFGGCPGWILGRDLLNSREKLLPGQEFPG